MKLVSATLILALAMVGCGATIEPDEDEAKPVAEVRVVAVRSMTIEPTLALSGVLNSIPESSAVISSPVAGQIALIPVHEGQRVNQGDTLVALDTRTTESDLARASAALREMKASLALLKRGPMAEEIEGARQEMLSAKEETLGLESKRDALKPLHDRSEVSDVQYQQAVSAAASAAAREAAAVQRLKLLEGGARPESVEEAEARVASAQADVDAQQLTLRMSQIQSPLSGVVAEIPVRIGMAVERSVVVARVTDLSTLHAQVRIPARYRTQVREGAPAQIRLTGTADTISGTLSRTAVEADPQTGDVDAFIRIDNPTGILQPGLACDVQLSLPETPERLVVPISAVTNRNGEFVVTVIRDEKAWETVVETGERTSEFVAITKGLAPGDFVATEGGYGLPDGTSVHVTRADQ